MTWWMSVIFIALMLTAVAVSFWSIRDQLKSLRSIRESRARIDAATESIEESARRIEAANNKMRDMGV